MKSALRTSALAITSLLAISASAFAAGAIEGTVRGPDGKPLKSTNVQLQLSAAKTAAQTVQTDTTGHYRFNNVSPGNYKVTVMDGAKTLGFIDGVKPAAPVAKRVEFDIKKAAAGQTAKKAKHMVWVPAQTGSNMGGRWVEDGDDVGTERVDRSNGDSIRKYQQDFRKPGGGG